MTYRMLTARDQAAFDAARSGAVIFGRDDRVAIVARGKHRVRFLHALMTAAFEGRAELDVFDATLTDAQGRLIADARCLVGADDITLFVARRRAANLIERLMSHRVAERVSLDIDEDIALVELIGPAAMAVLATTVAAPLTLAPGRATPLDIAGNPVRATPIRAGGGEGSPGGDALDGVAVVMARAGLGAVVPLWLAAGAQIGCHAAVDALEVVAGTADLDVDLPEGTTPWEAGMAASVALDKGCYLGQEALAMQVWRGQLRRHLCWVQPIGDALPETGALLRDAAGKRAGWAGRGVVFADGSRLGLATVSRKFALADMALQTEGGAAQLRVIGTTRPGVWTA
jgi:tRNA-modifying protein YgfZ